MTSPDNYGAISIEGLDKGKVVAALWNGSRAAAAFFQQETLDAGIDRTPVAKVMTEAEGQKHYDAYQGRLPKYLDGRYVGNLDVSGDYLSARPYDRELGAGRLAEVIRPLAREAALKQDRSASGGFSL